MSNILNVMQLNDVVNRMRVESIDEDSGGSGSTGSGVMVVNGTYDHSITTTDYYKMDKTFEEIAEFAENGGIVQIQFVSSASSNTRYCAALEYINRGTGPDYVTPSISLEFHAIVGFAATSPQDGSSPLTTLMVLKVNGSSFGNSDCIVSASIQQVGGEITY